MVLSATFERQTAPWRTDSSVRPMRQCSTPRRAVEGYQEPMVPLPHILRQALAPALRRLWPSARTPALPRPFQANPLAPHIRRAVHASQAFVVLGDPGDRGAAQYYLAQQLIREFRQWPFGCLVLLGDNVYDYGEPAHFDAALGQPYGFSGSSRSRCMQS